MEVTPIEFYCVYALDNPSLSALLLPMAWGNTAPFLEAQMRAIRLCGIMKVCGRVTRKAVPQRQRLGADRLAA